MEIKADVIASFNDHDTKNEKECSNQEEGNLSPPPTYSQVFSDNFPNGNFDPYHRKSDGHQSQHSLTPISPDPECSMHYHYTLECDGTKMHHHNTNEELDDQKEERLIKADDEVTGGFYFKFLLTGRL